jgi:hypothetical protein
MYTEDHELRNTYIWKTCTVAGGIYLFFLIERLLKVLFRIKQVNTVLQHNCKWSITGRGTVHLHQHSLSIHINNINCNKIKL